MLIFHTWYFTHLPLLFSVAFFTYLYITLVSQPQIFSKKHGRKHSLTGLCYLLWITLGFADLIFPQYHLMLIGYFWYDVILGVIGTTLTLFAAFEFQHKNVENVASGTLDKHATVSYGEMIEHSFYQALNLWQIVFLHTLAACAPVLAISVPLIKDTTWLLLQPFTKLHSVTALVTAYQGSMQSLTILLKQVSAIANALPNTNSQVGMIVSFSKGYPQITQLGLLFLVTLPWYFRSLFPINKFSDNYNKIDEDSTPFIRFLYRIKKYQYVFYKHCLLHGFHVSLLIPFTETMAWTTYTLVQQRSFRMYWLLLNTSYVMEFFLQTLVKKDYLKQSQMLQLQAILMTGSTLAALPILQYIHWDIAFVSLVCNFTMRKHDVRNTIGLYLLCLGVLSLLHSVE